MSEKLTVYNVCKVNRDKEAVEYMHYLNFVMTPVSFADQQAGKVASIALCKTADIR